MADRRRAWSARSGRPAGAALARQPAGRLVATAGPDGVAVGVWVGVGVLDGPIGGAAVAAGVGELTGGTGVLDAGSGVPDGAAGVCVGGTGVAVGRTGMWVGGTGVLDGTITGVDVATGAGVSSGAVVGVLGAGGGGVLVAGGAAVSVAARAGVAVGGCGLGSPPVACVDGSDVGCGNTPCGEGAAWLMVTVAVGARVPAAAAWVAVKARPSAVCVAPRCSSSSLTLFGK
jgi:hypothetical protein